MSNEIKGFYPMAPRRNGAVSSDASAGKKPATPPAATGSHGAKEKVTLTDTAQQLARLSQEAAAGPVVDEGKVQALRAAIESGAYQPDPVAIADALLRFEQAD